MKRIEVKLSLGVVAPLLDIIKSVVDSLGDDLAAALPIEEVDASLRETWRGELVAAQNGDLHTFLAMFDSDFFASGVIIFDEANADAMLRACAAVRLRLRQRFLAEISDDVLECGDVSVDLLDVKDRRAFMCYLFLATVQELIIEHLAPEMQRQPEDGLDDDGADIFESEADDDDADDEPDDDAPDDDDNRRRRP